MTIKSSNVRLLIVNGDFFVNERTNLFPMLEVNFCFNYFLFLIIFFSLFLETAFGKSLSSSHFVFISIEFLGAVDAIQQPITKEMLCSLIDHHLSQMHHHQDHP